MYLSHEYCPSCKQDTPHHDGHCAPCAIKKAKEAERMWEAQDTDTKLTNLRKRVEWLENHRLPMRF